MVNKFKENLKAFRKYKNLTQKEMAMYLDIPQLLYCQYERGEQEPNLATIELIAHTLGASLDDLFGIYGDYPPQMIKEPSSYRAKVKQEVLRCEDYFNLPDCTQYELINGILYHVNTPTTTHQLISMALSAAFFQHIHKNKGKCVVLTAPFAVELAADDILDDDIDTDNVLQPDILVNCDPNRMTEHSCKGAPDLVVEILSPSTRKRDIQEKFFLYNNFGVKEYWVIDPEKKRICIHNFGEDDYNPVVYTFEDCFESAILPGLKICLHDMIVLRKPFQHRTLEERAAEFDGNLNLDGEYY